ncbi:MAG TPA: tRNA (N6-threonylcarbamoyladenosine(37)-N6)-methyltransferase TrmO [Candidatus Methanofastidiosa archaeon]|nr:tRNA (N6-threonylcarbamoyladenosine(37)-N6)-methyltransferase TrmO [Candidatus Methanofastidiosa archaeon]HPR41436.1 tRNA (N6-threonylcarbamoyladenosine(37)-N6)-methyltransferase TrmO [Candidatus Methanofastidiosa archaeon]
MTPIGIIHTDFKSKKGMPIQAKTSPDGKGRIELLDRYVDGISDLEGFSHIILLYVFHLSEGYRLKVKPFLDDEKRGLFATRAPNRPNNIGLSVVKLEGIRGNIISISGTDMLDGTPLLDIKPYVPQMDNRENARIGWLEHKIHMMENTCNDGRFGG